MLLQKGRKNEFMILIMYFGQGKHLQNIVNIQYNEIHFLRNVISRKQRNSLYVMHVERL